MRKANNVRNIKKIKNSTDDFYFAWINHPALINHVKGLSAKELSSVKAKLKKIVDKLYLDLRVEEKYQFYVNLYLLYEICCLYFNRENALKRILDENGKPCQQAYPSLSYFLPYEPVFNKSLYAKANDGLFWLENSLKDILKNHIGKVREENLKKLTEEIEDIIKKPDYWGYSRVEKGIEKEIVLINVILARIKYARINIDVIYSFHDEQDKNLRKKIKSSLTRLEKVINTIIGYIEEPYCA